MTNGWKALATERIGVWGIGIEGRATLRRLAAEAITPTAIVDRLPTSLDDGRPVLGLDEGGMDALAKCDVVIKSPGISPYDDAAATLRDAGIHLVGGLGLWLAEARHRDVVCITGTKGKSTTTAIAGALCRGLGHRTFVGGNLGRAPWDPDVEPADWYVIEVSSYQAHDITIGPRVVAVTSLSQDHLTWHHGYENYVRDKLSLCTKPGVESVIAPAGEGELNKYAALLGPAVQYVQQSHAQWIGALRLLGRHNITNALVAQRALALLGVPGADDDEALERAAATYEPLPSRLTKIGTVGGVDFVDDSLSTNTLPTLAAVSAFERRRVALLTGGHERNIDYTPLAKGLAPRSESILVLTLPDNGPRIAATLRAHAPELDVREYKDLANAVTAAYAWASPDGVVLLSPAAPSFGVFSNYTERAESFERAMRSLVQQP